MTAVDIEKADSSKKEETQLLIENDDGIEKEPTTMTEDAIDTMKLAIPIFFSMVSWVGMRTTDTALLGHVSAEALSAAALSDLYTMCTGVLVQGRVLGILVGQAVGAGNPKLGGIYLQVSYAVLGCVGIFVFLAWNVTEQVWLAFGGDDTISKQAASDAGYYARILSLALPAQILLGQLSQFFSSQRIMHPEVTASLIALCLNLILGIVFVFGISFLNFHGYGFTACPIVTTSVVFFQLLFLWFVYIKIQGLHRPAWGGWAWNEITWERIKTFSALYFPAAFGMASDFWRVAVIGAVAAKLGEEEVGVFNTSYRIMWIVLIMVGAMASGTGIKMSMRLGQGNAMGAKQAGYVGLYLAFGFLVVITAVASANIRYLGMIFTEDKVFLDLLEEARYPFVATLFLMNLSVAIERIPISMGRTAEVFYAGLVGSWAGQVPGVILFTRFWRDDLVGLYTGMALGYLTVALIYGCIVLTSDWKKYADIAVQRSEMKQ